MKHNVDQQNLMSSDWRITSQESYLLDAIFEKKIYRKKSVEWDHDHCDFCNEKFSEDHKLGMIEGYYTENQESWVCEKCFIDFKDLFRFNLK